MTSAGDPPRQDYGLEDNGEQQRVLDRAALAGYTKAVNERRPAYWERLF